MYATKNGFTLEPEVSTVADIIEECTLPECRSLMNGGLCERVFASAKQHLDTRTDHSNPSVLLSAEDLRWACVEIPAPPGIRTAVAERVGADDTASIILSPKLKRNVVIHIVSASIHPNSWPIFCHQLYLIVRTDGLEVFRANCPKNGSNALFEERRILEVPATSHLIQFVLRLHCNFRDTFIASGVLAFSQMPFEGSIPVSKNDSDRGKLRLKAYWQ